MRVSLCKPYCPLLCFRKAFTKSSLTLPSPTTVKLEDFQTVAGEKISDEKTDEVEKNGDESLKSEVVLKSCLKKPPLIDSGEAEKRNVKWMDVVGKELVEIKEFEFIESEESDDNFNGNQLCVCVIQ